MYSFPNLVQPNLYPCKHYVYIDFLYIFYFLTLFCVHLLNLLSPSVSPPPPYIPQPITRLRDAAKLHDVDYI